MSRVLVDQLRFYYESPYLNLFEDVTLDIDTSWRTALVGRNGRGKTTFLRLLQAELPPSAGTIVAPERLTRFPYAPADTTGQVRAVVKESVAPFQAWEEEMDELLQHDDEESLARYAKLQERYDAEGGYTIDARIESELAALGLTPEELERSFDTLSEGQRTRALIAALFLRVDSWPLIDEPTNHLDAHGRDLLATYLARQPGFLLVSHDRMLLDRSCDHVLSINKSDVRLTRGSFSTWHEEMKREEGWESQRKETLKREIRALDNAARKRRTWSARKEKEKRGGGDKGRIGHLAARQMKRALSAEQRGEKRIEEKRELLKNAEKERPLRLRPERSGREGGRPLLVVEDVAVGRGEHPVLHGLSFEIAAGERIALVGPNGCGKTTLLATIAGELSPHTGVVRLPPRHTVVRALQTPLWSEGLLHTHLLAAEIDEPLFRTTMGSLDLSGEIFDRPLETFSQGERKKVELCRSLLHPAHLYLWDEPLNYVDLFAREAIEEAILEGQPTMLFVEHDCRFIERVATRVIDLGDLAPGP